MKTVLVTGGAGFISSNTCKALDPAGFLPIAFDDFGPIRNLCLGIGLFNFLPWSFPDRGQILDMVVRGGPFSPTGQDPRRNLSSRVLALRDLSAALPVCVTPTLRVFGWYSANTATKR
jgi:hypothetical protein